MNILNTFVDIATRIVIDPTLQKTILVFALFQGINVILNTLKTLIMTKKDSVFLSASANAVAFGFYSIVVNQLANTELWITVPVTFIMNFIGVYISYAIINSTKRNSLWKIEVYLKNSNDIIKLTSELKSNSLQYLIVNGNIINVYCYTQKETKTLKEKLAGFPKYKANIIEISKKF